MKKCLISSLMIIILALSLLGIQPYSAKASDGLVTSDLNTGLNTTDLVNALVGEGITVDNITFQGVNHSAGNFTGGGTIIGFDSGIILSTGDIGSVVGPNLYDATTTVNGLPGDADLDSLIPGYTTHDATVLEFDFVPTSPVVSFIYVFGSEEYNEYVTSPYNNVFGFFINGVNQALIPGTTTPVAINNVNGGNPYGQNPSNSGYYRNNDLTDGGGLINTELDGLTVVLGVMANVNMDESNHMKLAIADAGDSILDSDVFIKAGSLVAPDLTLAPVGDSNLTGTSHNVTATAYQNGVIQVGVTVNFTVIDGPHTGLSGIASTNSSGQASWGYTGTNVGMDTIRATATVGGSEKTSNDAYKTWTSPNQPPTANPNGPYTGFEGSEVAFNGTGSSDPDGDPLIYAWTFGDSGDGVGETPSHTYADNGTYTVCLTVTDSGELSDTKCITANIINVPPTADANGPYSGSEGSPVAFTGSATDPSSVDTAAGFTYTWDFGDSSPVVSGKDLSNPSHTYADNGVYTVNLTVTDKDGGAGTSSAQVTVSNVPPTVGEITAPMDPVSVDTIIEASANFTDPGVLDTHTAQWDWGDENTSGGTVTEANGFGSVTGNHTYTAAGVYTVNLTVTDDDGGAGQSVFQFVVVYDLDAGFVTGGGWIDSPEGAYTADPSLTGKANFGFVSKYKKGATTPTGQTEFQFHVADLNFHSSSYDWLVIAGPRAQYKGLGTINGEGNYGFMLVGIDGQVNGGGGVDKFRIKIWDRNDGDAIVYDNQPNEADDSPATTELGGGSIVIHSK